MQNYVETRTFSDEEDIYSYEKYRESFEGHPQRATDIAVIERGEQLGVRTHVVMAPTIFGLGTGPFNRFSVQLPYMIGAALKTGGCIVAKDGKTVWSHVHVEDVADLFLTLLRGVEQGQEMPHGRKGIYFCESGEHTHLEMSQRLAKAGKELGVLATDHVEPVSLEEAANQWMFGLVGGAEASFAAKYAPLTW
jgi:nucleoside-diphosphate-sugar epimerase